MEPIDTISYENYTIEIHFDEDPLNPLEDFDFLGTIATWHRRYTLGHEQPKTDPSDFLKDLRSKNYIILPVYMLDHSGITISTKSFNDPWDSGQLGFIYVNREKVKSEFSVQRISKQTLLEVVRILENEIKTYDKYLRGEVFGYIIKDSESNEIDSCWGFYDQEIVTQFAKNEIHHLVNGAKDE